MLEILKKAAVYAYQIAGDSILGEIGIRAPNECDPDHLEQVMSEMRRLGAPHIRAIRDDECWIALEGSHRIAAASALGLPVHIVAMRPTDPVWNHDMLEADEDGVYPLPQGIKAAQACALLDGPVFWFPRSCIEVKQWLPYH